jgi:hypothetical protein
LIGSGTASVRRNCKRGTTQSVGDENFLSMFMRIEEEIARYAPNRQAGC